MTGDAEWDREQETREQHFWSRLRQVVWTGLIVLGVVALMCAMAVFPAWRGLIFVGVLGVLAGICFGIALSPIGPHRPWAGLVFGGVTLPVLAAYLVSIAGRDPNEFHFATTGLAMFFAYGLAALFAVLWITSIWRRPARPETSDNGAAADGAPRAGAGI